MPAGHITTATIRTVFESEIEALGGHVSDVFDDRRRLFMRSILPASREVRQRDALNAGVALRANEEDIWLHPYVYRQVCQNGAIWAQAVETQRISCIAELSRDEVEGAICEAVQWCARDEVFSGNVADMRSAMDVQADMVIAMMSTLSRGGRGRGATHARVLERYFEQGELNGYGWMNAVTSIARDTEDPDERWRLEEDGGALPALLIRNPFRQGPMAEPALYDCEMACVA
jgi:hypothetical protein